MTNLEREKVTVLYTSKHSGYQKEQKQPTTNHVVELGNGRAEHVEHWGYVYIPYEEELVLLVEVLGKKINDTKAAGMFGLLESYHRSASAVSNETLVFVPEYLSKGHELQKLNSLGLLAVEQRGEDVLFVFREIDGISTPEGTHIAVKGRLNKGDELTIDGAPADFSYSPLHLLLNCACVYPRQRHPDRMLSRDQVAEARGQAKSWNQRAKKEGFGEVVFGPVSGVNTPAARILLPIGGSHTYLHFVK